MLENCERSYYRLTVAWNHVKRNLTRYFVIYIYIIKYTSYLFLVTQIIRFEITLFIYVITQMRKKYLPLLQDKQDGDNIFHNEIESFHIKVCANIYSLIYPSGIISSNISCQHNLLGIRFHFERKKSKICHEGLKKRLNTLSYYVSNMVHKSMEFILIILEASRWPKRYCLFCVWKFTFSHLIFLLI